MFDTKFKDKRCILQKNATYGDEIFQAGDEFVMTGKVELSIHGKLGRVIVQVGILPSKQRGDHNAEIFVDAHDLVVYS